MFLLLLTQHPISSPCSIAARPFLTLSSHFFCFLPCIIIAHKADLPLRQQLIETHQLFTGAQQSCGQSFLLQLMPLTQLGRHILNYLLLPPSALGSPLLPLAAQLLHFWTLLVFSLNLQTKLPHDMTNSLNNMFII